MLLPNPQETSPLHDNCQPGIHKKTILDNGTNHISMNKTMGSLFFCSWGIRRVISPLDYAAFEGQRRSEPPSTDKRATFREAEPKLGPFKNFSVGTGNGNQVLPCFHLGSLWLLYRIIILSWKPIKQNLLEGIIEEKKGKMKWVFKFSG